MLALLILLNI